MKCLLPSVTLLSCGIPSNVKLSRQAAAKECIEECPRQQGCVTSAELLENIKKSCAAGLAGNQAQYWTLSHRTRTFLRDKERYVSGLVEEVEGRFNANDPRPAY